MRSEPEFDCEYLDWWSKYYASTKDEDNDVTTDGSKNSNQVDTLESNFVSKKNATVSLKNLTSKIKKRKLSLVGEKIVISIKLNELFIF